MATIQQNNIAKVSNRPQSSEAAYQQPQNSKSNAPDLPKPPKPIGRAKKERKMN